MKLCHCRRIFGKRTTLCLMFFLTSSFCVTEMVVGYITNSTALVADSFHMLSDVLSLIIALLAVVYSSKTSKYNTYGWARAEVLGALANAVFLLALCFTIIVSAIQRFDNVRSRSTSEISLAHCARKCAKEISDKEGFFIFCCRLQEHAILVCKSCFENKLKEQNKLVDIETIEKPLLVAYVGSAGFLINIFGLVLFYGHAAGNRKKNSYDEKDASAKEETKSPTSVNENEQLNMKAVFLHVLGDALGSVVVIVSAMIIYFAEGDWRYYVDPAISLVIATIIISTTAPLLKESAMILLQNPPKNIRKDDILKKLTQVNGVLDIHEFHVWQLSGNINIASAHVVMHQKDSFYEVSFKLRKIFHELGVHSLTLQPEIYDCFEGESKCGSAKCCFLSDFKKEEISGKITDSTKQPNHSDLAGHDHCLYLCISDDCQNLRCCSKLQKQRNCYIAETDLSGTENRCYSDSDVQDQKV